MEWFSDEKAVINPGDFALKDLEFVKLGIIVFVKRVYDWMKGAAQNIFRERHVIRGVFNSPDKPTLAADNLAVPADKVSTTVKAYAQRNSKILQLLSRKPTANKVKTQQISSHTASPKEKINSTRSPKTEKEWICGRNRQPL